MGLNTEEFLSMDMWQYNAYSRAWNERISDSLSIEIQAAYMCAYWNSGAKHKKSLQSVLSKIQKSSKPKKQAPPIDVAKVAEQFRIAEEVMQKGYVSVSKNECDNL